MNPATLEFLKQKFSSYYQRAGIILPPVPEQREWGFVFFSLLSDMRMKRHIAFSAKDEVEIYLRTMVPRHVYYSTAYYALPSAPTMNDKLWSGADLIFDLDADHIVRGAYDMMLARVRDETLKLIQMLTDELGFSSRDLNVVFSGGRGYHVHIRSLDVRQWTSRERREIVGYVCGTGIDPTIMLRGCPDPVCGWHLRYRDALADYLSYINSLEKKDAVAQLSAIRNVSSGSATSFLPEIESIIDKIQNPAEDVLLNNRVLRAIVDEDEGGFYDRVKERAALTDEPVTTDIKRLIRLPGSLHGGSGFRVTPVSLSELPDFDPLTDAVVFGTSDVKIELSINLKMPILGNLYTLEKGLNAVPEAMAVFLCGRGLAEISAGGLRDGT